MIEFDELEKRLVLKLVYYGPALSGKTTNLLSLHDLLSKEDRGDLMVLDTKDERTIYFDLLPFFLTAPSGLKENICVNCRFPLEDEWLIMPFLRQGKKQRP